MAEKSSATKRPLEPGEGEQRPTPSRYGGGDSRYIPPQPGPSYTQSMLVSAPLRPFSEQLPPILGEGEQRRAARPTDLSQVLNPESQSSSEAKRRRRSGGPYEARNSSGQEVRPFRVEPQAQSIRAEAPTGSAEATTRRRGGSMRQRRNQPSRSPLARAASVGHGASAPGQEGVLQPLPGLGRVYSANPRSSESIPPMPVMMHHPSLPPIGGPQLGQPLSRKTSGLSMTPRTSYSSTTQAAYNSPVMSLAPIGYAPAAAAMSYASGDLGYGQPPFPPTLYQTGYPPPPLPMMQPGPSIEQRLGMPMTTSQQSNYQMMTLSSSGGGTYSLPVDVSAASKQADEKRRRNAGASHRFRERRKQKEKESNTQISNLEEDLRVTTDLKEAAEDDCDHYRTERDFLLQLIRNEAPQITVPPRPATPRHSRPALPPPRPRTMETSESVEPPSAVPQQQVFSTYPSLAGPSPYGPAVPLGPMMSGQPGADTMQHLPQGVSGPGIDPGYAQYPPLQHPPVARQPPADQMRYGSYPGPRP